MKQTILMIVLTIIGAGGAFLIEPFVGVAVYYLFAVLRPQFIWKWALPEAISWSAYVAWPTIVASLWYVLAHPVPPGQRRFTAAHKVVVLFGLWICLTYVTALNQDIAWPWFVDYVKIFVMFAVATMVVREIRQVWWLYLAATISIIYIGYELNFMYFVWGRVDIYFNGYGGLDNNGAGVMLAMGVPLAIFAWEATTRQWRWILLAGAPVVLHAVLMSYSRGAMVALLVASPLILFRSRRRLQVGAAFVLLAAMVPVLAGNEIRERFFSVENFQTDATANLRFQSWRVAIDIANDHPIFGTGVRNSSALTFRYGADMEGRVIHSQYLQTLADAGYPGMLLYLLVLGSTWVALVRTRRVLKGRTDPESRRTHSMLNGVECSMFVFCIGALFLSLEVFELPYLMLLLAAQTSLLVRFRESAEAQTATELAPVRPYLQPRAS